MEPSIAVSIDGVRIAWIVRGGGPPLILVHGGGGSHCDWTEAGYIDRLSSDYTVIAFDLRGHGASDKPIDAEAYSIEKMEADLLAVADACKVETFALWGMSFGSKICRFLAAHTDRIERMILPGATFGRGVEGRLRREAEVFCQHWPPILAGLASGEIQTSSLSPADQELLSNFDVRVMLAWVRAMLDWPVVTPAEMLCPTLWVAGSEDKDALASMREYEAAIPGSKVRTRILAGMDHNTAFDEIDTTLPVLLAFMEEKSSVVG
ncbi:MAG: alpha/beta fold hydrolase [Anaerolineales bacterium]